MLSYDAMTNAFATFFVTIDPPGMMAIFLALTAGMSSKEARQVAIRGTLIGMAILLAFMMIGGKVLETLGISIAAFRVAGGALLFYTAFEMVFEKRAERKEETVERTLSKREIQSIAVFPLAIPLIAGPGAISASILLAVDFSTLQERLILVAILLSVGLILFLSLLASEKLNAFMGDTMRIVLTRLFGIILAALSVQFIADGILTLAGS